MFVSLFVFACFVGLLVLVVGLLLVALWAARVAGVAVVFFVVAPVLVVALWPVAPALGAVLLAAGLCVSAVRSPLLALVFPGRPRGRR